MTIYIDAMGGDNAPGAIVEGAVEAIKAYNVPLTLVGRRQDIERELLRLGFDDGRVTILDAQEIIGFDEESVKAIRHKKDSSIAVALRAMKGEPDSVFVSAGSTGALLAGATLLLGRIKGVKRPGLGMAFPRGDGAVFIIDVGASADAQADYLLTYARLADVYCRSVMSWKDPSIGLINIGTEAEKGSTMVKEAYQLIQASGLNFYGNVESNDILTTPADILVCDGFTGNIILKLTEGLTRFFMDSIKKNLMSSLKGKIGALLVKDSLKKLKDDYDPDVHGGAPLLGVKGGVIKAHGSSGPTAIKHAVHQAILFADEHVLTKLTRAMEEGAEHGQL